MVLPEVAHQMALLPAIAALRSRQRAVGTWLLVGVFLVSWLADWPAHFSHAASIPVSIAYPLSQAGLVAAAFLPRVRALGVVAGLLALGLGTALLWGGTHPDLPFRAACWGVIVLLCWPRRFPLRNALLVYCGLGLLAWAGYVADPTWGTWGLYHGVRAAGIALACVALWAPPKATA